MINRIKSGSFIITAPDRRCQWQPGRLKKPPRPDGGVLTSLPSNIYRDCGLPTDLLAFTVRRCIFPTRSHLAAPAPSLAPASSSYFPRLVSSCRRGSVMEPTTPGGRGVRASPSAPTPPASSASAVEWLPLQRHPVFDRNRETGAALKVDATGTETISGCNLAAWDCSRLYLWDPEELCLHRLSVRFRGPGGPALAEAASPSEVWRAPRSPPRRLLCLFNFVLLDVSVRTPVG